MLKQAMQCSYKRNTAALSRHNCCLRRAMIITRSERVPVALGIQHAMRMRRIISSSVACPAVHFSTLSPKRHYFRKK
jgi:hypothetical protein